MDDYLSDNEQWEAFKEWLKANGLWILAGLIVGGLAIGGWRWWQSHTNRVDVAASTQYQQILADFDAGKRSEGLAAIDTLAREHAGSPYVYQANLAAARLFVEANELPQAAERLSLVARDPHDSGLATVARLRLARVQIGMGKPDVALATLGAPVAGAFASRYHEIRGDAYYAKGEKAAALDEYRAALLAGGPTVAENDVLNLKINDLRGVDGHAPAASAAPKSAAPGR